MDRDLDRLRNWRTEANSEVVRKRAHQLEEKGTLQKYLYIAVGGALGALARYGVGVAVTDRLGTKFPYGTFVINMTACVIIGFSLTFLASAPD